MLKNRLHLLHPILRSIRSLKNQTLIYKWMFNRTVIYLMDLSVYNKKNNITRRPNGPYQSLLTQDVGPQDVKSYN